MRHVSLQEAEENFSDLMSAAESGETIIVEKAGKPVVRFEPAEKAPRRPRRLGFLDGQMSVPYDFDAMCRDESIALFEGRDELPR